MTERSEEFVRRRNPISVTAQVLLLGTLALATFTLTSCSSSKPNPATQVQPEGGSHSTMTATPTPKSTPPASPFEDDPAVQALRVWAAQLAKSVNSGKLDDPALDALMTPEVKVLTHKAFAGSVGFQYPGPLPFSPIQITKQAITEHNVNICVVSDGFAIDPKTHKAHGAYQLLAFDAGADIEDGKWVVSGFYDASFSCDGVKVPELTW